MRLPPNPAEAETVKSMASAARTATRSRPSTRRRLAARRHRNVNPVSRIDRALPRRPAPATCRTAPRRTWPWVGLPTDGAAMAGVLARPHRSNRPRRGTTVQVGTCGDPDSPDSGVEPHGDGSERPLADLDGRAV